MGTSNIQSFEFRATMTDAMREADKLRGKLEQLDRTFAKVGVTAERQGSAMAKTFRGFGEVLAASKIMSGIMHIGDAMQRVSEQNERFSESMKGLISLDRNVYQVGALNDKVLTMSKAYGLSTGDIATSYYSVQSAASTLGASVQEDISRMAILMAKVAPVTAQDTASALTKGMISFGAEVTGVTDLMNRLKEASDAGGQTFEDMAHYFPAAATAGHALGLSLNEILASYSLLTQVGAKVSRTGTQMRDMFNTMLDPLRSGIDMSKGWVSAMEQLKAQGTQIWSKVYGTESIEAIINLTNRTQDYFELLNRIQGVSGLRGSAVENIFKESLKDTSKLTAQTAQQTRSMLDTSVVGQEAVRYELTKVAVRQGMPYMLQDTWAEKASVAMNYAWDTYAPDLAKTALDVFSNPFGSGITPTDMAVRGHEILKLQEMNAENRKNRPLFTPIATGAREQFLGIDPTQQQGVNPAAAAAYQEQIKAEGSLREIKLVLDQLYVLGLKFAAGVPGRVGFQTGLGMPGE